MSGKRDKPLIPILAAIGMRSHAFSVHRSLLTAYRLPPPMLADLIVVIHFLFVLFVLFGGLLVLRWRRVAYLHLPAAIWGAWIEFTGGICPLTPLEKSLRSAGGGAAYEGGFVNHYILPVLYPSALTQDIQLLLGCIVLALNLAIYGYLLRRERRRRQLPRSVL